MKAVKWLSGYGFWGTGVMSVVVAFLGVSPMAGLVALCYKFPIPFFGMGYGVEGLVYAPIGVLFYVAIGGWIVLVALPLLIGTALFSARTRDFPSERDDGYSALIAGLTVDFAFCVFLATLDLLIGPW